MFCILLFEIGDELLDNPWLAQEKNLVDLRYVLIRGIDSSTPAELTLNGGQQNGRAAQSAIACDSQFG